MIHLGIKSRRTLTLTFAFILMLGIYGVGPEPAPVQGDARAPDLPWVVANPEQANGPGPGVTPSSGPPGTSITVRGAGFRSFEPVESITLGGVNILGNRTVNTDANGEFEVAGLIVPSLDPGIRSLTVRVGSGDLETTATGTFEVTAPNGATPASSAAQALEPLGDALERVFYFNNDTKAWSFYDPRSEFADANTLNELVEGRVYWIKVTRDVSPTLNQQQRELTCARQGTPQEDCWNLVVW
jgi:hypothetical protein